MDGYSPAFMLHNNPLILISGLSLQNRESEPLQDDSNVVTDALKLNPEVAAKLLKHLQDSDASNLPWNSRVASGKRKFRIKIIERDYTLPPRTSNSISSPQPVPTPKSSLHSILSPLSPESALFPDGLIDPKWIEKHQELVPCAFVSFYKFTSDPSQSKKHDIQLKTNINHERTYLSQSGYKSCLVVALISDNSMVISPEIEERLSSIRRETGLDAKTFLLFLSSQNSVAELEGSVNNLISKIYPACIEYYRDLSKHSRRKKNRGVIPRPTVPPTLGTSQTLSSHGWNVRYDFKLGVFAEFRQEMESALRCYESSYETLLGTDILEVIASWSPRWNEARHLSDVLAFRIIRCLLWDGNYSSAVHRWMSHKERIKDFVDRRGKGSGTYGWAAWEARWATVMAETIFKASVFDFDQSAIFLPIEKKNPISSRTIPMEYLHHPGYWYKVASNYIIARRDLALQIPEENRSPPNSSAGPRNTSKNYIYDTYMCPEPHEEYPLPGRKGVDHASLILDVLDKAIVEFERRKQIRFTQELQLLSANELTKRGSWCEALAILSSLWKNMTYRKERWWSAAQEVLWALRKTAIHLGDSSLVISVEWELINNDFAYNSSLPYDLEITIKKLDLKTKQAVVLRNTEIHSFLTATFTFKTSKAKAGDQCSSQLTVYSTAIIFAAAVTISKIKICFQSNKKSITLNHTDSPEKSSLNAGKYSFRNVVLSDKNEASDLEKTGETFLSFPSESITVFELSTYFSEPGEMKAISASFYLTNDLLDLEYIHNFPETNLPEVWWGEDRTRKMLIRRNVSSVVVLPKPPKLDLLMKTQNNKFCINETISLQLSVLNKEDLDSVVALDAQIFGDQTPQITFKIDPKQICETYPKGESCNETNLVGTIIGKICSGKMATINISVSPFEVPAKYELFIKANYHLNSNLKTPMSKTISTELQIFNPFDVTFDFSPRVHPDPWPSFFAHEENIGPDFDESKARGVAQRWCLLARYEFFKIADITIEDVKIETLSMVEGIQCFIAKLTDIPENDIGIPYDAVREVKFDIITQSFNLDEQATVILDMSLVTSWRRNTINSTINHTKLPIPRLIASAREPRAIAEISYSDKTPFLVHFDVMIENSSFHFLSFGLNMESGEDFAFSGTKRSILQLLPLSRKKVRFNILPSTRGKWLGPIHCLIRDRYFKKVLRVMPTEGMKYDRDGIMIWIPQKR